MIHAIIAALKRLKQEVHEFKTSFSYIVKPCLKERIEGKKGKLLIVQKIYQICLQRERKKGKKKEKCRKPVLISLIFSVLLKI